MNEITRGIRERYWINIIRECSSSGIPKAQWQKVNTAVGLNTFVAED
ncbi:MAG: hypothetical protein IJR83_07460 [Clostridia bacterium]|nr:hypothetical protein [Clostridia bacterium]